MHHARVPRLAYWRNKKQSKTGGGGGGGGGGGEIGVRQTVRIVIYNAAGSRGERVSAPLLESLYVRPFVHSLG